MRSIQRKLVSLSSRSMSISSFQRTAPVFRMPLIVFQRRLITERSFASDELKAQGVKLDPAPAEEPIEVTESMVRKPNARVQKLLDEFLDLNIVEVAMFMNAMQNKLGISEESLAGSPRGGGGGGGGAAVAEAAPVEVKEKTIFEIKLKGFDAKAKIKIIKEVRAITGLGLKEAKDLVEKAPVLLKDNLGKEEAEKFVAVLKEAGAEVELL